MVSTARRRSQGGHDEGVYSSSIIEILLPPRMLVRDQRTLLAEVQQNDADDQAGDHAPHLKNRPGCEHDDAAESDDGMRPSPVCDLPGDRREEHADRTDDAEQAGDFGAEVVSGVELQRQESPEGAERAEQTALDDGRPSQLRLFPPENGQRFEEAP